MIAKSKRQSQSIIRQAAKVATKTVNAARRNRKLVNEIVSGDTSALAARAQRQAVKTAVGAMKSLMPKANALADQIAATRKKKATGVADVYTKQLPTATYSETVTKTPSQSFTADGNLIMTGTQFIDGIAPMTADFGGLNYLTDPKSYRIWEFKINPLEAFWPSVNQKANGFERYRVHSVIAKYTTQLPSATTTGKIAFAYLGDPSADIPTDYTTMSSLTGCKSGQVAAPMSMDFSTVLRDKSQAEGYVVQNLYPRTSDGGYLEADASATLLRSPFSVLMSTESLGDTINPDTVLGRLQIDYRIELIKAKQAEIKNLNQTFGVISFDTQHPALAEGYNIPNLGTLFTTGKRSIVYKGYGTQRLNFTIDLILDPGSDPLPSDFIVPYSPLGVPIIATVNDTIDGLAADLRRIIHVDGAITLSKNCKLVFSQGFNWKGSLNFNMTPAPGTVTSAIAE